MTGRARVFISCGQKTDEEIAVALEIQKFLTCPEQGYQAYQEAHVLRNEQSTSSIREMIFHKLKYETEYFLFIDFKRDRLKKPKTRNEAHRGSLYSHQELAIASFLDLPIIAFRQKGVKKENEGMASTMTLNTIEFDRPKEIIGKLKSKLAELKSTGEWNPDHRNELCIGISEKTEETYRGVDKKGQKCEINLLIHNLRVENRSKYAHARACAAFLSKCEPNDANVIHPPIYHLKWAELKIPTTYIFKDNCAIFPAVCIDKDNPFTAFLYRVVDLQDIPEPIKGPGEFILEYTVVSENFSTVKAEFKLTLGTELINSKFELIRTNLPG